MSSSTNNKVDMPDPVGVILMKDEPDEYVVIKFIGWLIVMVLFVMVLLIFSDYFNDKSIDGFILKQENSDYAHDGLWAGEDLRS